jgi:hypothetical protein
MGCALVLDLDFGNRFLNMAVLIFEVGKRCFLAVRKL